ncbi:cytochrome P450 [Halteromyces radiatus]|uniref:cytochrome P450 n=1 Tax=Halteromyces radiatus TaxID=101107 RepID=UPI002220DE16|nr:cytochrome P450 [Halteromyces radiatus]KAI8084829.1 cytochrome P450 [Halteromyces radiatus]
MGSVVSTLLSVAFTYLLSQVVSQYMWVNKHADGRPKSPWAPSPASLPWLWNGLEDYQLKGSSILSKWAMECGHFFSVRLGQKRILVLNDGPLVNQLLVDKDQYNSSKIPNGGFEMALTDNGKTVYAAPFSLYWSRIRRSVATTINNSPATWFSTLFSNQSEKLVHAIAQAWNQQENGGKVNADQLRGLVDLVALDTALIMVTNQSSVDPEDMVRLLDKVAILEEEQAKPLVQYFTFRIPVIPLVIAAKNILFGDAAVRLRNELLKYFVDWTLNTTDLDDDKEEQKRPLLAKVLADVKPSKNDPEPEQLKQDEIILNLMHITLHSYKYLSTIIFSMIQRLATLPGMQDRLRGDPEFAAAFVKESLRYDPPLRAYSHSSRVDQDVDVDGKKYRVDEDSELVVNLDTIHFNSDYYVDPTIFNPDRFLPSSAAGQVRKTVSILDNNPSRLPAHDHLAFGVSRRLCQGSRISEEFLKVLILQLVQAYSFHGGSTDRVHRISGIWSWFGREETIGTTIFFTSRSSSSSL